VTTRIKFKKGDRVVSTVSDEGHPPVGTLGTVNSTDWRPWVVWDAPHTLGPFLQGRGKGGNGWRAVDQDSMKLVPSETAPLEPSVSSDEVTTPATSAPRRRIIEL
jgi:hypothetical protein